MEREYYLNLAKRGLRMPIAADLVLREKPDHDEILCDANRLGEVVAEAARRYETPLAFPIMDLNLEKTTLLACFGIPQSEAPAFHFSSAPPRLEIENALKNIRCGELNPRIAAHIGSVAYIAHHTELVPVGMSIGPFSLATKLMSDPITPLFLAASGCTPEEEEDIALLDAAIELAQAAVERTVCEQLKAGARAIFIAEPAANAVFFSPKQLDEDKTVWEKYALAPNRAIKQMLDDAGVALIFHCCGELVDEMVRGFCELRPVILSLGSSRELWKDAQIVPDDIVLYGNLPSKKFYSDAEISISQVKQSALELEHKMCETGHPFVLGSECDVLSVPGCHHLIAAKVQAILEA